MSANNESGAAAAARSQILVVKNEARVYYLVMVEIGDNSLC